MLKPKKQKNMQEEIEEHIQYRIAASEKNFMC